MILLLLEYLNLDFESVVLIFLLIYNFIDIKFISNMFLTISDSRY